MEPYEDSASAETVLLKQSGDARHEYLQ